MKIAVNATILDNKPTGLGIFTINIIKELSLLINNKDNLVVYTSAPHFFEEIPVTIKLVSPKVQPAYGKMGGLRRFIWTQFVFPFSFKKENCDVVYSTTHHGSFALLKKQIVTVHDLLPVKFPNQHKLQFYYFKHILPLIVNKSHKVITVSENTKKDIVSYFNYRAEQEIAVVYNSYDEKHFLKQEQTSFKDQYGDYILFLGASYPHKNLERAIEAFLSAREELNDHHQLVITGGRSEYCALVKEKFKDQKSFSDCVQFVDYVKFEELPSLYSEATFLLYPSLYEGFGIPPLEAMACGCPAVVSNNSSLPEVCGDSALYIDPFDTENIKLKLKEMLLSRSLREELALKGIHRAKTFSWSKSASKLKQILEGA